MLRYRLSAFCNTHSLLSSSIKYCHIAIYSLTIEDCTVGYIATVLVQVQVTWSIVTLLFVVVVVVC